MQTKTAAPACLVALLLLCGCAFRQTTAPGSSASVRQADDWETTDLTSAGIRPEPINALLQEIRTGGYKNIHGVLIIRDGKLVVEEYFPGREEDGIYREYGRDTLHGIHSATKSINSLLIGIAIDKQLIEDVNMKASALFPEYADLFAQSRKDAIRLRHMLSMTAGLSWHEWGVAYTDPRNDHPAMNNSADPIRYVFERPLVAPPGTAFNYSSGISIVLGEVVHKASGVRADEFAKENLFGPLGIADFHWLKYPNGVVQTGGGLYMRPRDMAKIGQLILDGGRWQGRQIVSEGWIRQSMTQHAPDAQYGYQWWLGQLRAGGRAVTTYGAQGRGGQFILIMPGLRMVAVFTGWNDGNELTEQPFDMLQRYVLPAM